jgi:hypothetical protein
VVRRVLVAYRPPAAVTMMFSARKMARRDLLTKSISRETGFASGVRSRRQVAVPLPRGRGRRRDADPGGSGSEGEATGVLQNRETGGAGGRRRAGGTGGRGRRPIYQRRFFSFAQAEQGRRMRQAEQDALAKESEINRERLGASNFFWAVWK